MILIHDKRIPEDYITALRIRLPDVLFLPFDGACVFSGERVYSSILSHPDIYFFQFDKETLIYAPCVPEKILRVLLKKNVKLIKGSQSPHGAYPDTVGYNAVRVGNIVFHNLKHTDPVIAETIKKSGLRSVNVTQGYARCSILAVSAEAMITSDKGIAKAACAEDLDVLFVPPGSVLLPGEKTGFIGGAGGVASDGTVYFIGDPRRDPATFAIKAFCEKHRTRSVSIENMPLYDGGGLMLVQ